MLSMRLCVRFSRLAETRIAPTIARSVIVVGNVHRYYHEEPGILEADSDKPSSVRFEIPRRVRQKSVTAEDAVALIRNGDTLTVSGFVAQATAEAILRAVGKRYEETGEPNELTLVFGGGPGDWDWQGLNHFAKKGHSKPMLKRTIGSHYGQIPMVAKLAINEEIEAWNMPMGSISRMLRAQATHSPGHITTVGAGTFVDPAMSGGAINEKARKSAFQPVTTLEVEGMRHLMYRAMPINVGIIRGTTADTQGNITIEQESLKCDQLNVAAATKNSGGIVIAQVKRLAETGSLPPKQVTIPGAMVDCVVVVDEKQHDELHPMSYVVKYNPSLSGEIKAPASEVAKMELSERKIIARRGFFQLKPNQIVNLGIGLPEGVASVAAEEGMLNYITLSTEPGVFGGQPASGHSFGPAYNATALIELNQMFDFYDGGGLDICFLGAAQIASNGDVNVSRMSKERLTGPGGFIDISQSTKNVVFMSPLTVNGLEISTTEKGHLKIDKEGKIKKYVNDVYEVTFSGDEAVRRGQQVLYVTERAVFRRSARYDVLELIEIAPGIDLKKDVLDQLEFEPIVSPNLTTMDTRIFLEPKMGVTKELFGSLKERFTYHEQEHVVYLDLFGISLTEEEDVEWFFNGIRAVLAPLVKKKGPLDMVINYDGFDLDKRLEERYAKHTATIEKDYYKTVKRYAGGAFKRAQLGKKIHMSDWKSEDLFNEFEPSPDGKVSLEAFRDGVQKKFQLRLAPSQLAKYFPSGKHIDFDLFDSAIKDILCSK